MTQNHPEKLKFSLSDEHAAEFVCHDERRKQTLRCTESPQTNPAPIAPVFSGSVHDLANIVGNPHTPESKWMAACVVAGQRNLHNLGDSWSGRIGSTVWTLVAAVSFLLATGVVFPAALIGCAHTLGLLGVMSPTHDLRTLALPDVFGYTVCLMSGMAFLVSFLSKSRNAAILLSVLFTIAPAILTFCTLYSWLDLTGALIMFLLSGLATIFLGQAGSALRNALPKGLTAQKLICGSLGVLWMPAGFAALSLSQLGSNSSNTTTTYEPANLGILIFACCFLAYCISGVSYVVTRISGATCLRGCTTISLMLQSPMVLGFLFAAIANFLAAATGKLYVLKGTGLLVVPVVMSGLAMFGSYVGLKLNSRKSKSALRSNESEMS